LDDHRQVEGFWGSLGGVSGDEQGIAGGAVDEECGEDGAVQEEGSVEEVGGGEGLAVGGCGQPWPEQLFVVERTQLEQRRVAGGGVPG
jgi:hypothetical protein